MRSDVEWCCAIEFRYTLWAADGCSNVEGSGTGHVAQVLAEPDFLTKVGSGQSLASMHVNKHTNELSCRYTKMLEYVANVERLNHLMNDVACTQMTFH